MINYLASSSIDVLELLKQEERIAGSRARTASQPSASGGGGALGGIISGGILGGLPSPPSAKERVSLALLARGAAVAQEDKDRILSLLLVVQQQCDNLQLSAATDRLTRVRAALKRMFVEYSEIESELRVLREAIEDGLKTRWFYFYPADKATLWFSARDYWKTVAAAFPSATQDAMCATDCYCLSHPTASVFHLMRVAEIGLRAFAKSLRVAFPRRRGPLEWQDWHVILVAIDEKIEERQRKTRGPAKDAALFFYLGAMGQFESFKDVYRNNVMHTRKHYDMTEAASVLTHVQEFMTRLASRVQEKPKKGKKP